MGIREYIESREDENLAPYACRSALTRGRRHGQVGSDSFRTDFQRDRDRILYSTAFRRLKYKTQVYVVHEGDFYRTRLTHSLEVMQHARTLARALRCNEDLVEAISYGHDLGHPPFGHAAERRLDELTREWGGFDHNRHGLRVVDYLETIYPDHPGLDLCFETREGLARHNTVYDRDSADPEFASWPQPSVEAQIVNLADEMAFVTHDLDDALSCGLVPESLLEREGLDLVAGILGQIGLGAHGSSSPRARRLLVRHLIELLSVDAIAASLALLEESGAESPDAVRGLKRPVVGLSAGVEDQFCRLKEFLMEEVYSHPSVLIMGHKGADIVARLFESFMSNPRLMPLDVRDAACAEDGPSRAQLVVDYLASVTDRQANDIHRAMFDPEQRVLRGF